MKNILSALLLIAAIASAANPFACGPVSADGPRLELISASGRGEVRRSTDGGASWRDFGQGLPANIRPLKIFADGQGTLYLTTASSGLFRRAKDGARWEALGARELLERPLAAATGRYRKITAFAADPENPLRLAAAAKHALHLSDDGGASWRPAMRGIQSKHYLTALSMNAGEVAAGTSFGGVFVKRGAGAFSAAAAGLPAEPYSDTLSFIEETGALRHSRAKGLFAGFNFTGKIFRLAPGARAWTDLHFPESDRFVFIHDIAVQGETVFVSSSRGVFKADLASLRWEPWAFNGIVARHARDGSCMLVTGGPESMPPLFCRYGSATPVRSESVARDRRALYAGAYSVRRNLARLVQTIRATGHNAIVIDVKDDFGAVHIPVENPIAREIGAVKNTLDVRTVIDTLKRNNIYAIARIVAFKDRYLFRAYGGRYAIWNRAANAPWRGSEGEYWVDPHSSFVRQYVIDIARAAAAHGFDEIQFDYIRFPSDGPVHLCAYRFREEADMFKSEVLTDFLRSARRALQVPISVDLYGFTGWYRFGNLIGQDIEAFSESVDVICPMVYPSHFGSKFARAVPRDRKPYHLVHQSSARSRVLNSDAALIRPYLQAFNLLSPTWGPGYLRDQTRAASESGASGYTFWNAAADYSMVTKAFPGSGETGKGAPAR